MFGAGHVLLDSCYRDLVILWPMGQAWQVFKVEPYSPWLILSSFWLALPLPAILGRNPKWPQYGSHQGLLKTFFLSAFVEGQRGLNSNNLIQFWLVLVEANQLVWSCRLAAELLLINTQRLGLGSQRSPQKPLSKLLDVSQGTGSPEEERKCCFQDRFSPIKGSQKMRSSC